MTVLPSWLRLPPRAPSSPGTRGDIQGLRALAVLLVVVDHVSARRSGGFVGVDMFFVVSGFLITGLLVREHQRDGQHQLRRLLPPPGAAHRAGRRPWSWR